MHGLRSFPLAKMDRVMRAVTWALGVVAVAFLVLPLGPPGSRWMVGGPLLGLIGAVFLLWRPVAFELSPGELRLRYPLRSKRLSLASLQAAELLSGREFRARFGFALRVGVGGLFGGFGWLYTSKGWVEMDVSRTDGFVLLTWPDRSPLLLTPEQPEAFVQAALASRG